MANEIHVLSLIAQDKDEQFNAALLKAGFKSRWDWDQTKPSHNKTGEVKAAYLAKVKADEAVHAAWENSRKPNRLADYDLRQWENGQVPSL